MPSKRKSNWKVHFEAQEVLIVNMLTRSSFLSGLFWGLLLGFIMNTVVSTYLASIYVDIHRARIVDNAVEQKLINLGAELSSFKEEIDPTPAQEYNE